MSAGVNQQWLLARVPAGPVRTEDFRLSSAPIPEPREGEILVRNLYLSCDPTQRSWMSRKTYLPPVLPGEVMRSFAAGEVLASRHPRFREGDRVYGMFGWQEYCAASPDGYFPALRIAPGTAIEDALGVFGLTGLTAYFGLLEVAGLRPGETVVVSGAAGATGSVAGQIAKLHGCRVVGIAGGSEKCDYLTRSLGFDQAIDHKTENTMTRLRESCPGGLNVFFDNVGGRTLDAALLCLAMRARIVICGSIAAYDDPAAQGGPKNYMQLLNRRSRMEGFVMTDFNERVPQALDALAGWVREGKIRARSDVAEGFAQAPAALLRLFTGENRGKQLVRIAEPSGRPA